MFSGLSINPFLTEGRIVERPQQSNQSQFDLGNPDIKYKIQSTHRDLYTPKPLNGNRAVLNKPYLKPNYSGFQLKLFPQEKPFLTSNLRDFTYKKLRNEDKAILDEKTKNFIRNSKIDFGNYIQPKESIYQCLMINPKQMKPRFDYDKIQFHYDPYNIHPITGLPVWKDAGKMFPFDYFCFFFIFFLFFFLFGFYGLFLFYHFLKTLASLTRINILINYYFYNYYQ
jgi:hypothetical protein